MSTPRGCTSAFPSATLARLRAIKAEYDPQCVFRDNFAIEPLAAGAG